MVLLLLYEFLWKSSLWQGIPNEKMRTVADMAVTRALAGLAFLPILFYLGYRVMNPLQKPFGKSLLFALPAIFVVVNNLPIYPLLTGQATVRSPLSHILLLAAECFFIGLFEEVCFRGVVFLGFLERRRATVKGRFWSIILTAAVFGAIHLTNLFFGASPLAVLLQVGYSFLIGAMCSVVLLKSANIWLCVILHGTFDFCGALIPTCGEGVIWEPVTVTLTAAVAVAATVILTVIFFRIKREEIDRVYVGS